MGWTQMHRPKGMTNDAFWRQEWPSMADGILEIKAPSTAETYIAWKRPGTEEVIAIVILTTWQHNDRFNFAYKEMDETAGPVVDNCPESILNLLTPTTSAWANQWRDRCRAKIAGRKRRRERQNALVLA